ncbi:hypothetical protein QMG83_14910 [Salinibacterium sp. G-O1]|uniref:hypothetical protein n=1 Tax=Salinibacterium sp. G-O1 TaxID=3046208 RepID=UPI0024BB367B|nr:hypothetical protein [Salinibacterium sp. G-O1]MDJ0336516.1 hypothetical protein [Salinibacterium sp. G-O1]
MRWLRKEWHRADRLLYVLTFAVTTFVTFWALQLWKARIDVPLTYSGDALPTGAHFKTVIETGWYEYQRLLGAPFGQTYNDFPTADNLHFIAAKVLSLFTHDWAVAMNVYFIIGFPLAAVAALWLFRRLGMSRAIALALGVVFAISPYHFLRGESHLWLSSYYVIPFALALVISAIRGEALWALRATGPRLLRWATPKSLGTLAIAALTGTAQSYYAVFFLILLAFSGLVRLVGSGQWKRFWGAAVVGVVTAMVMLINMAPDIIYAQIAGDNPGGFERNNAEAEIFALKLSQLILPWPSHRIGFLAHIRNSYDQTYPLGSEQPALGAIAAFGFIALFLIIAFMASAWGSVRARSIASTPRFQILGQLAALTFVAFLFSTIGGLSTIISFVTASLRGWNRMSILIALICLAAVGLLLDAAITAATKRIRSIPVTRALAVAVAIAVVGVGYVDQTPASYGAAFASQQAAFDEDQAWITSVERSVPTGSSILQLPYQPFPETVSVTGVLGSNALIPYLHSKDLRWSSGGIKGRPRADYPEVLEHLSPGDIATLAAASGFAGIHIDLTGLPEADRADLVNGLTTSVGTPSASSNGTYVFFNLEKLRSSLASQHSESELSEIAAAVTNPVTIATAPSFSPRVSGSGTKEYVAGAPTSTLTLTSERDEPTPVSVNLTLLSPGSDGFVVTMRLPDGSTQAVNFVDGIAQVSFSVVAQSGQTAVGLDLADADGAPSPGLIIAHYDYLEDSVAQFLR